MMHIYASPIKIDVDKLMRIYHEADLSLREQRNFCDDLYHFFNVRGAVYAVWEITGDYVCALRVEPYRDGVIIAGLHTRSDMRGMGHASALLSCVLEHLQQKKVYSHIAKSNKPSIFVHQKCGFKQVADFAVFLDGTVSHNYVTYCVEN